MASTNPPIESTLTAAMRLVTAMIEEHEIATINANPEPVDCDALYDLIQAAQKIHTKFCPIASSK